MNTDDLTIAEAEARFAEEWEREHHGAAEPFCEPELIAVYRRVTAEMLTALENLVGAIPFSKSTDRPEVWDAFSAARAAIALAGRTA